MKPFASLGEFRILRPLYETPQCEILDWLATAHSIAASEPSSEKFRKALERFGCSPRKISQRGHELSDFKHTRWNEMEIFGANGIPSMGSSEKKTFFYSKYAEKVFSEFYRKEEVPSKNLFHVTCTGYESPSAAQKLVSNRKWGDQCVVTHLYHMGCYASISAVRLALGLPSVDIVHTEMCSLHLNPLLHDPEQLVIQTLFGDGYIKYTVRNGSSDFQILACNEQIVPESIDAMSWYSVDWGMKMGLSRHVPEIISRNIEPFLRTLAGTCDLSLDFLKSDAIFAIHPGGPKIIDHIQEGLGLADAQISFSRNVLFKYGNMSSATLPHIWAQISREPEVKVGTKIVSLAFGPGLTIAGMILEKSR